MVNFPRKNIRLTFHLKEVIVEDLWKLREMGYRLNDVAERAEYDRLVKRFHEEEQKTNMRNLLYGEGKIPPPSFRPGNGKDRK